MANLLTFGIHKQVWFSSRLIANLPEEASNKKRERLFAKRQKQPIFEVNNDGGNHRSRLVVEAFHYVKTGTHFADEYKGYENHLIYDCCSGYLLPLEEVEIELKNIK